MKKKFKFKINGDTMTTIVVSSLFFCVLIIFVGVVLACYHIDISSIVASSLTVFGTELGICGVMTIFNRHNEALDRRIAKNQNKNGGGNNEFESTTETVFSE